MPSEIAILCLSLGCLGLSIFIFLFKRRMYAKWERATGQVVELVTNKAMDDRTTAYRPRIAFKTSSGEQLQFLDGVASSPPVAKVGDSINVIYDPKNPNDAKMDRFMARYLGEVVAFIFGILGTLIYVFGHSSC